MHNRNTKVPLFLRWKTKLTIKYSNLSDFCLNSIDYYFHIYKPVLGNLCNNWLFKIKA